MRKMQTTIKINAPQPGNTVTGFFNTRSRDLRLVKRVGWFVLVLLMIGPTVAMVAARQFPESGLAIAVRAFVFDPTVVDTKEGKVLVESGQSLVRIASDAVDYGKEKFFVSRGRHPDQESNVYLAGLVYLGENLYSTSTPVNGMDYESAECSMSEESARIQNKVYCRASIKAGFDMAKKICAVKWQGQVASHKELTKFIFQSLNIATTDEVLWTRQEQIDKGFFSDTVRYMIYDPKNPDQYKFIEPDQEKHAFFCVASNPK